MCKKLCVELLGSNEGWKGCGEKPLLGKQFPPLHKDVCAEIKRIKIALKRKNHFYEYDLLTGEDKNPASGFVNHTIEIYSINATEEKNVPKTGENCISLLLWRSAKGWTKTIRYVSCMQSRMWKLILKRQWEKIDSVQSIQGWQGHFAEAKAMLMNWSHFLLPVDVMQRQMLLPH